MRFLSFFLAAAGVQMAAAAPTTTKSKATTSTACQTYSTNVITFDALKPGQDAGTVQDYSFTGFTVQTGQNSGVKPSSGKNVAMTPYINSYLNGGIFYLKDFTFACVSNYPFSVYFPVDCSLKIVGGFPSYGVRVTEFGPFTYKPDYSKLNESDRDYSKYFPLQKVKFNDSSPFGGQINFFTSDAPGTANIVFDTITLVKQNSCPN